METDQSLLQPVSSFAAGNSPAATLVLIELHRTQSEFHYARCLVEHDHPAGAQHRARFHQRVKIHCDINFVGRKNRSTGSARYHALQTAPFRISSATVIV